MNINQSDRILPNNIEQNGRVQLLTPDIHHMFSKIYDKIPVNQCATYRDPLLGQWDNTQLSNAFFSQENIHILQNGIRAGVYKQSGGKYVIGYQDCDALKIVMRSTFLQHSVNQPNNITEQIAALNKLVLDYCIPHVFGETQGYLKYLYDASTLVVPMDRPVIESQRDRSDYKLPTWF